MAWFSRCSDQNTMCSNKKKMQFNLPLSVVCAALRLFLAWERGTAENRGWTGVCPAADPTSSRLEQVFPDTEFCLNRGSCRVQSQAWKLPPFQMEAFIGTTRKCIMLFGAVLGMLNNLFTYQRESGYFWDPYLSIVSGIKESKLAWFVLTRKNNWRKYFLLEIQWKYFMLQVQHSKIEYFFPVNVCTIQ